MVVDGGISTIIIRYLPLYVSFLPFNGAGDSDAEKVSTGGNKSFVLGKLLFYARKTKVSTP